ncbi:MAG: hypothetical protein LBL66_03660, partial [Clostridiales bacterium]|nr:hypothetical protein [Clostridiales bacterium]
MKKSVSYKAFLAVNAAVLFLLSFLFLAPYVHVIAKALNQAKDTDLGGIALWPRKLTLDNFAVILTNDGFAGSFLITVA